MATAKFGEGEEVREERVEDAGVESAGGEPSRENSQIEVQLCCAVGPPGCSILHCGTSTCNNKSNIQKAMRARRDNREIPSGYTLYQRSQYRSSAKSKREYLEGIVAMAMLQYCEKVQRVRAQREREHIKG